MVSKTFYKSMRTISVNRPESKPVNVLIVRYKREVSAECFLRKLD